MASGHRSAGLAGASSLKNTGHAVFQGPSGTNAFTAFWVKLDTITAATYYSLFDIGIVSAEVLGMRIDGPTGHVVSFAYTNAGIFTQIDSLVSLTAGLWYHCQTNWGATIINTIYDHTGAAIGGASGANGGDGSYRGTATPPLTLGARSDGTFPISGEIDSFAHWRSGNVAGGGGPDPTLPTYLPDSGKAWEYADYAGSAHFALSGSFLSAWYDFNEISGAATWKDSSANGASLTAVGQIVSQLGAGYG